MKDNSKFKRLNPKHDDLTRKKIQVTQLVNRLTDCAMGNVELSQQQIRAIEILLKKALPDLAATQITGDASQPLTIVTGVMRAHEVPASDEDGEGEALN